MTATVLVRTRTEVLDPPGAAVRDTLVARGVVGVRDVRLGRRIELEVDAGTDVAALCSALLVHAEVEIAEIVTSPPADRPRP